MWEENSDWMVSEKICVQRKDLETRLEGWHLELVLAIRDVYKKGPETEMQITQILLYKDCHKAAGKQPASVEATSDLAFSSISFEIPLRILK